MNDPDGSDIHPSAAVGLGLLAIGIAGFLVFIVFVVPAFFEARAYIRLIALFAAFWLLGAFAGFSLGQGFGRYQAYQNVLRLIERPLAQPQASPTPADQTFSL